LRRLIVIVLASLATVSGVAFAAALRPSGTSTRFTLSVSPAKQSAVRGATASFSVNLARSAGFTGTTALRVTGLPRGVRASWELDDGKLSGDVPATQTGAILRLRIGARAALGRRRVNLRATAGSVKQSRPLTLTVERKGLRGFSLKVAPARQVVQQGLTAGYKVSVANIKGFRGRVRLRALALPPGAAAQWSKTLLRITTRADQRLGSTRIVLEGSGRSGAKTDRRYAVVVLTVVGANEAPSSGSAVPVVVPGIGKAAPSVAGAAPVGAETPPASEHDFTISGDLATQLYPGAVAPLDVVLTNPQTFDIRVKTLTVRVVSTTKPGCDPDVNYGVAQYSGSYPPLVLHPGSTRLSDLVADSTAWPHILMHDLQSNQDACQGAILSLVYAGAAT
jgi:hypothetical protein